MIFLVIALTAVAALALAYWARTAYGVARTVLALPKLARSAAPEPDRWPTLSVVVPACDEADKIAPAAGSLLEAGYPDLEVVLVDDRSRDGTGEVIDRLAAQDSRVRAVHVAERPDGWLGKVNALRCGMAESRGALVLLTDADVHFAPGSLSKAVAYMEAEGLDHVAAFPDLWPAGVLVDAIIGAFIRQFISLLTRPWAAKPGGKAYLGIGAFNLLRRSAFEKTEGFEWLRMEVADDMGVGLLMKRAGARCRAVAAFGLVGLHWYRSFAETVRGSEKGASSLLRLSPVRTLLLAGTMLILESAPLVLPWLLLWPRMRLAGAVGAAVAGLHLLTCLLLRGWAGARLLPLLITPVLAPVGAILMLRAHRRAKRLGGAVWRGTFYPAEALQAGRRVKVP